MDDLLERRHRVLVVDDDPDFRRLLNSLLASDYEVREAVNGEGALEAARGWLPDLVLLDFVMPGLDGFETCRRLKAAFALAPQVVIVSGRDSCDDQTRAFEMGADDYIVKPIDPQKLRSRVSLHLRLRASQAAAADLRREIDQHHAALRRAAAERTQQIVALQDVAVFALAKLAESRDNETGEHLVRLREYAQALAQQLQRSGPYRALIDETFLTELYRSSPLHDIGKVGIPDQILLKPEPLTMEEFEAMKRHTIIGANVLREAICKLQDGGFLAMAVDIAMSHHERWDGGGYPEGIAGEEIPLAARIVAVADVFDALTSDRPYKRAWPLEHAREAIHEAAGSQFDPAVVAAFDQAFPELLEIHANHAARAPAVMGAIAFAECLWD